jgi:hypothetical protein
MRFYKGYEECYKLVFYFKLHTLLISFYKLWFIIDYISSKRKLFIIWIIKPKYGLKSFFCRLFFFDWHYRNEYPNVNKNYGRISNARNKL